MVHRRLGPGPYKELGKYINRVLNAMTVAETLGTSNTIPTENVSRLKRSIKKHLDQYDIDIWAGLMDATETAKRVHLADVSHIEESILLADFNTAFTDLRKLNKEHDND